MHIFFLNAYCFDFSINIILWNISLFWDTLVIEYLCIHDMICVSMHVWLLCCHLCITHFMHYNILHFPHSCNLPFNWGLFSSILWLQVFRYIEQKFGGQKLPEGEVVKLLETSNRQEEMMLFEFKDMVLYVLDTAANISLFLDICNPACKVFHQQKFELK